MFKLLRYNVVGTFLLFSVCLHSPQNTSNRTWLLPKYPSKTTFISKSSTPYIASLLPRLSTTLKGWHQILPSEAEVELSLVISSFKSLAMNDPYSISFIKMVVWCVFKVPYRLKIIKITS